MNQPKSTEKPFAIPKQAVVEAFKKVKENQGGPGVDGCTIEEFESELRDRLYVTWNRMASGSYVPPPVKVVNDTEAARRWHADARGADCGRSSGADGRGHGVRSLYFISVGFGLGA